MLASVMLVLLPPLILLLPSGTYRARYAVLICLLWLAATGCVFFLWAGPGMLVMLACMLWVIAQLARRNCQLGAKGRAGDV